MKYTNIYYFYFLNKIGGTETFLYQLAKKYNKYDLTIIYRYGHEEQINRLKKYVRCVQFTGQEIECEKAFFNYGADIIDSVKAKEYYFVVHADYAAMIKTGQLTNFTLSPKITKCIGVSKLACKNFTEATGRKCELSYNPFTYEPPKKILNLISATRLSKEKGKTRIIKLAEMLDQAKIPYIWTIFTTDKEAIPNPNIIYMEPKMNIVDYIANADYLVQLSDNEGYCYSVIEALTAGVPVIVTPCPVFEELGLIDGKNCYIIPFNMNKVDVKKIYTKIPKFEYIQPKDGWEDILVKEPNTWPIERDSKYVVKATSEYEKNNISDSQLNRIPKAGEKWTVDYNRMITLTGNNRKKIPFVKVVETIKPKK